ncbi:hypothetical protein NP233_g2345 [Leucocoprinus birnbaumii]|uniref:F-box domain-containing protein n=1 Tax=Leucocoprinus birnbaumii TaxID=56174 RepID=A0AAD5W1J4_9AGAR|nr:hypothetical protein NP233_g2345 [Leucocoprinus birnbaumii]
MASEEYASIVRGKIQRLDHKIDLLRAPRAVLLRELNAFDSATRNLPLETLSGIFLLACPSTTEKPPPQMVLRSVSTHWRDVVDSTPYLWNSIDLDHIGPEKESKKWYTQYLEFFLERSGRLPLDLRISFSIITNGGNAKHIISLEADRMIKKNISRIRSLKLSLVPEKFFDLVPRMKTLVSLSIHYQRDFKLQLLADNMIQELAFTCEPATFTRPESLGSITQLRLENMCIGFALGLFLACPNVVEFTARRLRFESQNSPVNAIPDGLVVLQNIRKLVWEAPLNRESQWNRAFLRRFRFPALEHLRWEQKSCPRMDESTALFFARLPATLKILVLVGVDRYYRDEGTFFNYIRHDTAIETIELVDCKEFISYSFSYLGMRGKDGRIPFPKLSSLNFSEDKLTGNSVELFLGFVDFRLEIEERVFHVLAEGVSDRWADDVWIDLMQVQAAQSRLNFIVRDNEGNEYKWP